MGTAEVHGRGTAVASPQLQIIRTRQEGGERLGRARSRPTLSRGRDARGAPRKESGQHVAQVGGHGWLGKHQRGR